MNKKIGIRDVCFTFNSITSTVIPGQTLLLFAFLIPRLSEHSHTLGKSSHQVSIICLLLS